MMKVLLATDGLACSRPAEDLVAGIVWPRGTTIEALTVVRPLELEIDVADDFRDTLVKEATTAADEELRRLAARIARPGTSVETVTATAIDAVRTRWAAIAHDRALRLERAGVHAREGPRTGEPAEEIVGAAIASEADLVVMGSHGRTGLDRVLLGSVARNVLTHAPCSVLVARRGTVPARIAATTRAATA